ncbi:MAG: helix-turn-helix domain-containing protein, partial [Terriglobales bacterium]
MDLQGLCDFNLAAGHGGFGCAGRVSGRVKATLSRRVAALEQGLGVRLIERGSDSLRLTIDGRGPLPLLAETLAAPRPHSKGCGAPARGRVGPRGRERRLAGSGAAPLRLPGGVKAPLALS